MRRAAFFCLAFLVAVIPAASTLADTSGSNANESGQLFESSIRGVLKAKGFVVVPYSEWAQNKQDYEHVARLALRNVPYRSIYGHDARVEFLLKAKELDRDILIQGMRQSRPGSVDEKLPYVWHNARLNYPERETILIVIGDGWKPGALRWAREQMAATEGFSVMSFEEFLSWAGQAF